MIWGYHHVRKHPNIENTKLETFGHFSRNVHITLLVLYSNPFSLIQKHHAFFFPRKKKKSTRNSNETIQRPPVLVGFLTRCYMLGTQSIQTSIVTVHHLNVSPTIRPGWFFKKMVGKVSSVPKKKVEKGEVKQGNINANESKLKFVCVIQSDTLVITRVTRINITLLMMTIIL